MSEPILLPYQRRWVADTSRVRVIEKSRRIGISWATAAEAVVEAARTSGQDQWYIGYDEEMTREFILDASWWAKKLNAAASDIEETIIQDPDRDIRAFQVLLASGHRVTALSSSPRNFRSRKGHAIVDEAAFHQDLDQVIAAALAFLVWGGRVTLISTHNGVENEFNRLCEDIRAGKKPYSLHRVTIDDAIADGLYERVCLVSGSKPTADGAERWLNELLEQYGDDADQELRCIPARSGGSYIKRSHIEACRHEAPVVRLDLDDDFALRSDEERGREIQQWLAQALRRYVADLPNLPHTFGQDFGRVSDLTVMAPLTYCQDTRRRIPLLVELRNVPYTEQATIMEWILRRLPQWSRAGFDATGNGGFVAERAAQIFGADRVDQISLSQSWYAEWLPRVRAGFEDRELWVPYDLDVVRDLLAFRLVNGIPALPAAKARELASSKGKKRTRHGDAAIAIAIAYVMSLSDTAEQAEVLDVEASGFAGGSPWDILG